MSSHHIIRDEQEPPLIVLNMFHNWRHLNQLLGWSPMLIIDSSLKNQFESRQIKLDGFLIPEESAESAKEKDLIMSAQDPLNSIFKWVEKKNYTALHIFCDTNFMLRIVDESKTASLKMPMVFFTEEGKYILKPSSSFKKWYVKGSRLKVIDSEILKTENLTKVNEVYTVPKDGMVKVLVSGEHVLLKEII